jgi:hypothetical protein
MAWRRRISWRFLCQKPGTENGWGVTVLVFAWEGELLTNRLQPLDWTPILIWSDPHRVPCSRPAQSTCEITRIAFYFAAFLISYFNVHSHGQYCGDLIANAAQNGPSSVVWGGRVNGPWRISGWLNVIVSGWPASIFSRSRSPAAPRAGEARE